MGVLWEVWAGWRRALSGAAPSVSPASAGPAGTPLGRCQGSSLARSLARSAGGVPTSCAAADAGDNEALCVAAERGHLLGELMGVLLTPGQVEENKVYSR